MRHRLVGVAMVLAWGTIAIAQTVSIQRDDRSFRLVGWNAPATSPPGGWPSIFAVYAGVGDLPPLAGTYVVDNHTLVFRAAYPISPGVHYRAVFHPPDGGRAVEQAFDAPSRTMTPSTRVERVYPSTRVLPSNTLRLYIYFSAPMSRGEVPRRVRLLDRNGHALDGVFLPGEELWDPNNQRLTMTFDPGRIKRGLNSNEKMGPPIAPGAEYTLAVDRGWPDANGVPLVEGFRKSFRGGPAVRTPPDPGSWHVTPPAAGTSESLRVSFPRPMNYALLQRMLQVSGPRGHVEGTVGVDRQETEWRFTPREAWPAGAYRLVVDTGLEDLAGNHLGQPFDIDVFERVTEHITTTTVAVPFVIATAKLK